MPQSVLHGPRRLPRLLLGAALALLGAGAAVSASAAEAASSKVELSGTVYTFDNQTPIVGATVRVMEFPGLSAQSGQNGVYRLRVPDGRKVTPYVEAAGHHGIHLQTFVTTGADIERVNFQIPTDGTYLGLAAILGVDLDENGDPAQCVVVSTFANEAVRDLSFDDFVAFGAHGVAGATAGADPALPDPTYFNSSVIPDTSLTESSIDGGVIWLDVPEGVYTFRARHPTERFATFRATCAPGRLVNANPPQGLYQLRDGEKVDKKASAALKATSFKSAGPGGLLRVSVKAREYVTIAARLLRNGHGVGRDELAGYDEGTRALAIPVGARLAGRALKLRLGVKDALGNRRVIHKRVRVPASL